MHYWQAVLDEFLNRHNPHSRFVYTNLMIQEKKNRYLTRKPSDHKKEKKTQFFLGDKFPGVYFTLRELECAARLLKGYTNQAVARELSLSTRTIEFYINNMKTKLNCQTKSELIHKMCLCRRLLQLGAKNQQKT